VRCSGTWGTESRAVELLHDRAALVAVPVAAAAAALRRAVDIFAAAAFPGLWKSFALVAAALLFVLLRPTNLLSPKKQKTLQHEGWPNRMARAL
jgi:hypothetical protein